MGIRLNKKALREIAYAVLFGFKYACFIGDCFVEYKKTGIRVIVPEEYLLHAMVSLRNLFDRKIYGKPPERSVVIDIGAWIGDTTLYYLYHHNYVIAIEPTPRFFKYLKINTMLNGAMKAVLLNKAYHAEKKRVGVIENGLMSRISGDGNIETVTLKELIENTNLKEFFLKMDCEGCEYYLLNELDFVKDYMYGFAAELHDIGGKLYNKWIMEVKKYYNIKILKQGSDFIIIEGERKQ